MHIGPLRLHSSALTSLFVAGFLSLSAVPFVQPAAAQLPAKLLLQTVCVSGNAQEYVAIYNPNNVAVDLSNYYLTDAVHIPDTYYLYIVNRSAGLAGGGTFFDFHVRFPAGATIAAGDTIAIAHQSAATFAGSYGRKPAFEVAYTGATAPANDPAVPDMRPAFPGSVASVPDSATLSNGGECVNIYYWDGQSDLVTDVDYVFWGSNTLTYVNDKTGKSIDGPDADSAPTAYKADTTPASQVPLASSGHANGNAFRREDFNEGTQRTSGGNGVDGRDETSENLATTWSSDKPALPPFVKNGTPPPPAVLTAKPGGPYSGTAGQSVSFNGASSIPAQGQTITAYSWNFGDGSAAGSGATTSHTYAAAGSYSVTLTVTGSGGGTHSASTTATISPTGGGGGGAAKKLLLQTVCVTGNSQEYISIYNPNNETVDLSNYYLSDALHIPDTYYLYIVNRAAGLAGGGTFFDFHIRFPAGATIAPRDTIAVAHQSAATFAGSYGRKPAFEVAYTGAAAPANDPNVPDMRAAFPGSVPSVPDSATLSNAGECMNLYYWDGQTDIVTDVDYMFWGSNTLTYVNDKTGKSVDGPDADSTPTAYKADTTPASQVPAASTGHTNGNAFRREDFNEGTQKTTGGNGVDGRDETSENLATTWSGDKPAVPPFVKTSQPTGELRAVVGGPYTGGVNQAVSFSGAASTAPTGGSIASYAWTFGDGGTGTGATTTHTYTAAGTYPVSLTVTSNTGATHVASTTATITTVAPPPTSTGSLQVKARTFLPSLREKFPITINVASGNQATLRIFDLQGREVVVLFDGDASGTKTYQWDGHDAQLMDVATGTYICDLEVRSRNGDVHNYQAPIVVASRMERK